MANWNYRICARDGSAEREIVNAYDRELLLPLCRMPTASCRVRLDHPLVNRLMDDDLYLKVYRDTTLKFIGPILTSEEEADASSQHVRVNAVGGFWYLLKRLWGTTTAGDAKGTAGALWSRSAIAQSILNDINGAYYSGISGGTFDAMTANAHVGPVYFAPVGETLQELSVAANGYEWEVAPFEPTNVGSPQYKIGEFNAKTLIGGVTRSNVVFEWGIEKPSVASYKRIKSRETLVTVAHTLPPGFPEPGTDASLNQIVSRDSVAAVLARNRIEEVISTDLQTNVLRGEIAQTHIDVRAVPRHTVNFTLAQNAVPSAFASYNVGDFVRGRAVFNGTVRFDALFRVWAIRVKPDNAGNEGIELELQEGES